MFVYEILQIPSGCSRFLEGAVHLFTPPPGKGSHWNEKNFMRMNYYLSEESAERKLMHMYTIRTRRD
jgi:hypothetical protein